MQCPIARGLVAARLSLTANETIAIFTSAPNSDVCVAWGLVDRRGFIAFLRSVPPLS